MLRLIDLLTRIFGRQLAKSLGLGVLIAFTGLMIAISPLGREWEEDLGLTWLFRLRGPVEPPDEVAVVSIDRESSVRLGLPESTRKWPRDVHARLLDRLTAQGASVVVFDVMFQDHKDPSRDQAFAEAVRRAGNVILFENLKKRIVSFAMGSGGGRDEVVTEQRVPPIPALADAALGLAPYVLPHMPRKVNKAWLFKPEAGDAATLPVVALQAHTRATYDRLLALIRDLNSAAYRWLVRRLADRGRQAQVQQRTAMLRQLFLEHPPLSRNLLQYLDKQARTGFPSEKHLSALITALSGPDSIYLNYYGPPRTIDTLPFDRALTDEPGRDLDMAGRAVFVGAAPRIQPEQQDGFYTPYTLHDGLDIGGVEIAATAFANLLDQTQITRLTPGWQGVLLIGWGLTLGLSLRRPSGGRIPLAAAGAGGAYFAIAYLAFARANLWLPLVTPLLAQLLPATFGAILWRYRDLHRERENIRHAFGMHLPLPVVDQLAKGIDDLTASTAHAYGICLSTDAENYTTLSERLTPSELKQVMNDYYAALFPPVRGHGGVVADVVADSMLAIWTSESDRLELRKAACSAALDVLAAVEAFNRVTPRHQLPTRMGLHCGEIVLGHVGALDHYEYRAVGDIVNTASRIEGLCKQLGTWLLVSGDVVADLDGLRVRPLGRFLLKGKTKPLRVAELVPQSSGRDERFEKSCLRFSEGLGAFGEGNFSAALKCFQDVEQELGADGPSAFYRRLCLRYLSEPVTLEWTGVVRLADK